jgi:polysaccharide export outer membrane protein
VGCKSYGPSFDVAEAPTFPPGHDLPNSSFLHLGRTNAPRADLLQPPADFFRLGPGDVVEVEIIGEPASATTLTLGPDGKIYYSILPGVQVWGLTLAQARQALEDRLNETLRVRPDVSVTLKSAISPKVWALGSLEKPGVYALSVQMTLLELLSLGGGVSASASDLGRSFVMRDGNILDVDVYRLVRNGDLSQNIYLRPGDYVYLGSALGNEVYLLGAIAQPNAMPYSDGLTLLAAITRAGGSVPYAHMSEVVLIRGSIVSPRVAAINFHDIRKGKTPDVRLEPGDIIYVPFSPFRKIEILADQVLSQFVRSIAVNEGRNAVSRTSFPVGVSVPVGPVNQ